MDTIIPDVSEFNPPLSDKVLAWSKWSKWVSLRACDGTYKDKNFLINFDWVRSLKPKLLVGYFVYLVYPPSESSVTWQNTFITFKSMIGDTFHQRMVRTIDVERWGRWSGDHSADLNKLWNALWQDAFASRPAWQRKTIGIKSYCAYLDRSRVVAYGNASDLDMLWPRTNRPRGLKIVLADYSGNPKYPGKIIHQYTDKGTVPGLGTVDLSSADGYSPTQLAKALGLWRLVRRI